MGFGIDRKDAKEGEDIAIDFDLAEEDDLRGIHFGERWAVICERLFRYGTEASPVGEELSRSIRQSFWRALSSWPWPFASLSRAFQQTERKYRVGIWTA